MKNGIKEKHIRKFVKIANELSELSNDIQDVGYISVEIGSISLVSINDEEVETVYVNNLSTGYL